MLHQQQLAELGSVLGLAPPLGALLEVGREAGLYHLAGGWRIERLVALSTGGLEIEGSLLEIGDWRLEIGRRSLVCVLVQYRPERFAGL